MSATERWRMPSGRIATIDLQQTPEAIEDARALLREFGEAELINEEAPAGQGEGETKKPAQDSVGSKATRRARAAAARPGTIAADHRIIIDDTPDTDAEQSRLTGTSKRRNARLADAELAALPLIVRRTSGSQRVRVWRTADGRWWRRGGTIRIQKWPTPDGERAFVINVWRGANSDDVKFMQRIVEGARRGEDFDFLWSPITSDWADEHTYHSVTSRPYSDPYTHGDYAGRVSICDEPLCRSQWHDGTPLHELDTAEGPGYSIIVGRVDDEPLWHVDVYADGAEFTPRELTGFVNDLQWMRAECERANEDVTA